MAKATEFCYGKKPCDGCGACYEDSMRIFRERVETAKANGGAYFDC